MAKVNPKTNQEIKSDFKQAHTFYGILSRTKEYAKVQGHWVFA